MKTESLIKPPASEALKSGRVILSPGEEIGEHVTEKREELLVVLRGTATLAKEDERIELHKGKTHYIPEGIRHNVINMSDKELEYVYIVSLFG
jgi:mannose-6-phosphate isomerase